jgi:hypothetical protein
MPWLPEVFSAPVLQQVLDQRRRDALVAVPYFDGLLAGDPDPLVESFAGAPELYEPVRGRVKDEAGFRAFVADGGPVDLPVAVVAERRPDGHILEIRVYFDTEPLTGRSTRRAPLLQPAIGLTVPAAVASYVEGLGAAHDASAGDLRPGRRRAHCALEYNVVPPGTALALPRAGFAVFVADGSGGLAAVRAYGDSGA